MIDRPWRGVACLLFLASPLLIASPQEKGGSKKQGGESGEKGKSEEEKPKSGEPKSQEPKAEEEPEFDLAAWGAVKEVKGTGFYSLSYRKSEDGKRPKSATVFIKMASDAAYFQDRQIAPADLKEGDTVWVLGRPVEQETPVQNTGSVGVTRQFQNVQAIVKGTPVRVNRKYKDRQDPKLTWCKTTVVKGGQALKVKYEDEEFKVVLGPKTPLLLREAGDSKGFKSGISVEVWGAKSTERPEGKSAADSAKESFLIKKVFILDRRLLQTVYPMLLE